MGLQDVYIFDKTALYVSDMLSKIFSWSGKLSSLQEIINYGELIIEHTEWAGMWKLAKETCHTLNVRYPCSVDVTVTSMDLKNLTATVSINTEMNESPNIPESAADVPIRHLWVKIHQPNTPLDLEDTAKWIDMIRFFYDNIWWPWENMNEHYTFQMMEDRVSLWEDIAKGLLPSTITHHLTEMRKEALLTNKLLRDAEITLSQLESDEAQIPANLVIKLGELNMRLEYLRTQFTIYESPHLRQSYIEELKTKNIEVTGKNAVEVVWKGGNVEYLKNIHDKMSEAIEGDTVIKITDDLIGAFKSDITNVMIFEGSYNIPHIPLPELHLRGFGDVILNCDEPRLFLLNLTKDTSLHSIKLQTSNVNNMIVVQQNILYMNHCILDSNVSTKCRSVMVQGILVLNGGTLLMENCILLNLYTGLFVKKGAKVKLVNCQLENNSVAVQMFSGSEVVMENCKIINFEENAIRYEETSLVSLPTIDSTPGLTITNCQFTGDNETFVAVSQPCQFF